MGIMFTFRSHGFDGLVLDMAGNGPRQFHDPFVMFVEMLSQALHNMDQQLILVIPPATGRGGKQPSRDLFDSQDFEELLPFVDRFSLMTYDYSSSAGRVGPNAPLNWVMQTILRVLPERLRSDLSVTRKLLVGMNWYGYDFGSTKTDAIVGHAAVQLLEQKRPALQWDETQKEHLFRYADQTGQEHTVFYPTLMSIQQRLLLIEQMGVSVSIWEIGQGLDYFHELL
eukprot:TRINITY_DN2944_c0_g1_i1.p1 TRINITY_DN2944_c0_g1~~TRINITY_DN2944_c0_g1_i1.p1  ORF type:complete len:226 (-),score=36.24 TRINITY_DN2944_c0_g1_i1:141-818(-)